MKINNLSEQMKPQHKSDRRYDTTSPPVPAEQLSTTEKMHKIIFFFHNKNIYVYEI